MFKVMSSPVKINPMSFSSKKAPKREFQEKFAKALKAGNPDQMADEMIKIDKVLIGPTGESLRSQQRQVFLQDSTQLLEDLTRYGSSAQLS